MILKDYTEFEGRHRETGTVRNVLAYQGVKPAHTGEPISEALLMGIAGGTTVGYFTFEYTGYRPHIALLTRNTFDPLLTLFDRLALPRDVMQTSSPEKAEANLIEVLESGRPALVWADAFSLPYNDMPYDEGAWAMWPVVVYGVDGDTVYLADRAACPITIDMATFTQARARVKKDKFRVMTLDAPNLDDLPAAVSKGIWACINLMTEAPPKGKRDSFGLAALQYWSKMLRNERNKNSWARYFAPGERMWMALVGDHTQPGSFSWLYNGAGNAAERGMYADFLREAATILDKPGLNEAANLFQASESEWAALTDTLLPDDVAPLAEAKSLLKARRDRFMESGADAIDELRETNTRLNVLREEATANFPLEEAGAADLREAIAAQVDAVHDAEKAAVACLQDVMT